MQHTSKVGDIALVLYTDGSARANPGFAGYGVFGHHFKYSTRPKNIKHPGKSNLYFNHNGIDKTKTDRPIEVLGIVEAIHAIEGSSVTNNYAELKASLEALRLAHETQELDEVTIITDSNYIVSSFTDSLDKWVNTDWKRQDGKPVSHQQEWYMIYQYRNALRERGVRVALQWVKGHNEDYGNETSDLYSVIGSNAARVQTESNSQDFITDVYSSYQSYKDYKDSYGAKDFIYHFKDLFFASHTDRDKNYCFISTTEDDSSKGRRVSDSIFLAIEGYVPELVTRLKSFYRSISRNYTCTCSIKLSALGNRDILRIAEVVDVRFLVRRKYTSRNVFSFVKSDGVFMEENTMEFPFIMNINKLSYAMQNIQGSDTSTIIEDITPMVVKDGKIAFSNKDRFLDLTERVHDKVQFTQKLLLGVGYDIPNYLALKRIESGLHSVALVLHKDPESNFYTAFTKLTTEDRNIYSVNVPNKFLAYTLKTTT